MGAFLFDGGGVGCSYVRLGEGFGIGRGGGGVEGAGVEVEGCGAG